MTQLIFNIVLILILITLGFLLIKRWRKLKEGDDDIEKLIAELTTDSRQQKKDHDIVKTLQADAAAFASNYVAEAVHHEHVDDADDLEEESILDQSDLDDDDLEDTEDLPVREIREPEIEEITARFKVKDLEMSSDELKLHEKAKRKARVIVREIELYNKEKTEMGLKAGNLYSFLKDQIESGRRTYNESVPENIRAKTRYFEESLTALLAKGDKSILGMDDI